MSIESELIDKMQELIEDREQMRLACDRANSERRRQVRRHREAKEEVARLKVRVADLEGRLKRAVEAERARIAELIRAELVCCDIYEMIDSSTPDRLGLTEQEWAALDPRQVAEKLGLTFHAICHWGGYAAALAEEGRFEHD